MANRLQGRHAVVTGAGRGIGAAIARALSAEGAQVTLLGRTEATLSELAAGLSTATCTVVADVTNEAQVKYASRMPARSSAPCASSSTTRDRPRRRRSARFRSTCGSACSR